MAPQKPILPLSPRDTVQHSRPEDAAARVPAHFLVDYARSATPVEARSASSAALRDRRRESSLELNSCSRQHRTYGTRSASALQRRTTPIRSRPEALAPASIHGVASPRDGIGEGFLGARKARRGMRESPRETVGDVLSAREGIASGGDKFLGKSLARVQSAPRASFKVCPDRLLPQERAQTQHRQKKHYEAHAPELPDSADLRECLAHSVQLKPTERCKPLHPQRAHFPPGSARSAGGDGDMASCFSMSAVSTTSSEHQGGSAQMPLPHMDSSAVDTLFKNVLQVSKDSGQRSQHFSSSSSPLRQGRRPSSASAAGSLSDFVSGGVLEGSWLQGAGAGGRGSRQASPRSRRHLESVVHGAGLHVAAEPPASSAPSRSSRTASPRSRVCSHLESSGVFESLRHSRPDGPAEVTSVACSLSANARRLLSSETVEPTLGFFERGRKTSAERKSYAERRPSCVEASVALAAASAADVPPAKAQDTSQARSSQPRAPPVLLSPRSSLPPVFVDDDAMWTPPPAQYLFARNSSPVTGSSPGGEHDAQHRRRLSSVIETVSLLDSPKRPALRPVSPLRAQPAVGTTSSAAVAASGGGFSFRWDALPVVEPGA
eukprot:TRINITY_DN2121_c0_g2_i1.p1 TRINITY_DN2121_c0_g2~~TRINITY_DN2121_c0_g2_i1.p1  ORF type:complete len:634 (-),score=80.01 TRINITY_DN2121_c0_g2_i1:152-1969(-)